jgi:hypothetical protein
VKKDGSPRHYSGIIEQHCYFAHRCPGRDKFSFHFACSAVGSKEIYIVKVSKSRKKNMLSSILPKNERWGNFQYIKLPQRSFFGRIQDAIIWIRDLLTFTA